MTCKNIRTGCFAAATILTFPVFAGPVSWVDWTSATTGPDTVLGNATQNSQNINVNTTGPYDIAVLAGSSNQWAINSSTYTSSPEVDNPPDRPDMIRLSEDNQLRSIEFSSSVINPVMAWFSLGTPGQSVSIEFDSSFVLLNSGEGQFGGSTSSLSKSTADLLVGTEGYGIIQFSGVFDSISFTATTDDDEDEFYYGYTIGLPEQTIPVPSSLFLTLSAFGLAGVCKRKKKTLSA